MPLQHPTQSKKKCSGVPLYNSGNPQGCAQVYKEAAQNLLDAATKIPSCGTLWRRALDSLQQLPSADARAWALRRALDAVAANDTPSPPSESISPPALVRDFSTASGLEVAGFIVNDTVMGGRSDSELVMSDQAAVFRGTVTKRGGGGFASVRFQPRDPQTDKQHAACLHVCRMCSSQFVEGAHPAPAYIFSNCTLCTLQSHT
ncbi:unnamed protein product [Symbiodinium natans]|uniref:NADH:ubiquinone oxidoreductase intermediate-associated protein 30 domain-containing protein n=1 Tax=Symbiodinium natans TaxID=878477 RepID=A0A812TLG4_9DINO|nr:unnamed protein product [Symbiodinium natans]